MDATLEPEGVYMKKYLIALLLISSTGTAFAENARRINDDTLDVPDMCIAKTSGSGNVQLPLGDVVAQTLNRGDVICNAAPMSRYPREVDRISVNNAAYHQDSIPFEKDGQNQVQVLTASVQ